MNGHHSSEFNEHSITPVQRMLSSCAGAMLTSIMMTPFDVVKVRIQSQQKEFLKNKCYLYCNGLMDHICYCGLSNGQQQQQKSSHSFYPNRKLFTNNVHYNGTFDGMVKIVRNEGLSSLWAGLPPTLVMAIPATVVYFTIYDQLRLQMLSSFKYEKQPFWLPMFAGAFARTFAATLISPLEMVRTKMQSKSLSYSDLNIAVKTLVKNEGYRALWTGLGPTLLRDVPFSALYWANYEFLKSQFKQTSNVSFQFTFIAGAVSGTIAAILTLPFDVVKTHRQIELGEKLAENGNGNGNGNSKNSEKKKKLKSTKHILRDIYNSRGIAGLFSGLSPRIMKVAPACAIMISTYEFSKNFFLHYNMKRSLI